MKVRQDGMGRDGQRDLITLTPLRGQGGREDVEEKFHVCPVCTQCPPQFPQ